MPTIQNEDDFTTFEWEESDEMDREAGCLVSNVGDLLPLPEDLDVPRYLYIAFIWIPGSKRQQGVAKQLIRNFLSDHPGESVYIELCKCKRLNGLVLENFLVREGFHVEYRLRNRIGMLKKS